MLLILPAVAYLFLLHLLHDKGLDWRRSALAAAVIWGTGVTLSTEGLSAPGLVSRGPVAVFWLAVCVAVFLYRRVLGMRYPQAPDAANSAPSEALPAVLKGLLAVTGVAVLLVGVDALAAPPSTWDAMLSHLPRVTMWTSNHSVRFYPTPDFCQLVYGPWPEYAMLHTVLLWGSDRFVNLIEFFSLIGSAIGVSLIAQRLGAGARGQALAAIASATIPEGILEASGAMNNYVISFWIVTTVVFLLDWNENPGWLNTLCVGLSAGLAILTKGTAYVYLPFLVLACWWMGTRSTRILFLKRSPLFLVAILALNAPHYVRCYQLTGTPLGLPLPFSYPRVEMFFAHVTVQGTIANIIRNVSLHFGTPTEFTNRWVERAFRLTIRAVGANPDDAAATWLGAPYRLNRFSLHEIYAGNPLQMALLLISIVIVAYKWKDGRSRHLFWYTLAVVAGFVFFSARLLWTVWSSRYHLPLFVLGAAVTGLVLERYASRRVATLVAALLVAYALPCAAMNRIRSLVPIKPLDDIYHARSEMYFYDQHKPFIPASLAAADTINHLDCGHIAIDSYTPEQIIRHSPTSFYVYPLLALIHVDGQTRRVRYSGVDNLTNRYASEQDQAPACAVICFDCAHVPQKWDEYRKVGGRASVFDYIVVFSASGAIPNLPQSNPEEKRLQ
jgi:hypothetical protein